MATAAQIAQWEHTSAVLALTYNASMNRKGPARQPHHFNPYLINRRRKVAMSRDDSADRLGDVFGVKRRKAPPDARDGPDSDDGGWKVV